MKSTLALAVALGLFIGACGNTGGTAAQPSPSDDPEEAMLAFAQCMREQGVDFPDPGADGDVAVEMDPDSQEFSAAEEVCGPLLEDAVAQVERPNPEEQAELQEQLLAFAACMREQGVDFPDPQFDGGVLRIGPSEGVDPDDPELREANQQCQELLPAPEVAE